MLASATRNQHIQPHFRTLFMNFIHLSHQVLTQYTFLVNTLKGLGFITCLASQFLSMLFWAFFYILCMAGTVGSIYEGSSYSLIFINIFLFQLYFTDLWSLCSSANMFVLPVVNRFLLYTHKPFVHSSLPFIFSLTSYYFVLSDYYTTQLKHIFCSPIYFVRISSSLVTYIYMAYEFWQHIFTFFYSLY